MSFLAEGMSAAEKRQGVSKLRHIATRYVRNTNVPLPSDWSDPFEDDRDREMSR